MQNEVRHNRQRTDREQFPVDVKVRGIRFTTDLGDIMRIVVMSDQATTRYQPYREYHYGNTAVPVDRVDTILLRSVIIGTSDKDIDGFAQGMAAPLDISQVVRFSRGIYNPSASSCRLFKATDPDDATQMMGLLIEQDAQSNLVQATWYKTSEATAAFLRVPEQLEFQLVKNGQGMLSVDPTDIGGWTWHHSTNFGIGLSAPSIRA